MTGAPVKPLTRGMAADPFHEWSRRIGVVKADLDALAFADRTGRTHALIEVKRSRIPVGEWKPFEADRASYRILHAHANQAGVPLVVLYHRIELDVLTDDTPVAIFRMFDVDPAYVWKRSLTTLGAFAERLRVVCGEAGGTVR